MKDFNFASITLKIDDIQEGDRFYSDEGYLHWTATAVAEFQEHHTGEPMVVVSLVYGDGGHGFRTWDPGTEITIRRQV